MTTRAMRMTMMMVVVVVVVMMMIVMMKLPVGVRPFSVRKGCAVFR